MDIIPSDEVTIIKPSLRKLLWLDLVLGALLSLAVVAIPSVWGWLGTFILGPLFLIALYIYRPSATFLRLHLDRLDISTVGRRHIIYWRDVAGFHIGEVKGDKRIGILYTQEYLLQKSVYSSAEPDSDGDWIRDLYVMRLDKLCETLNNWVVGKNSKPWNA